MGKAFLPSLFGTCYTLESGLEGKLKWSLTDISALKSCAVGTSSSPCYPTTSQYLIKYTAFVLSLFGICYTLGSGLEGELKWNLTDISALKSCAIGTLSSPFEVPDAKELTWLFMLYPDYVCTAPKFSSLLILRHYLLRFASAAANKAGTSDSRGLQRGYKCRMRDIPMGSDSSVNVTGGLSFLNKEISTAVVPGTLDASLLGLETASVAAASQELPTLPTHTPDEPSGNEGSSQVIYKETWEVSYFSLYPFATITTGFPNSSAPPSCNGFTSTSGALSSPSVNASSPNILPCASSAGTSAKKRGGQGGDVVPDVQAVNLEPLFEDIASVLSGKKKSKKG
ncbi:hypothetical protein DFH09DRAFT_1108156 [Mycena vulgaris]|nr:hypothetical protein DFH09DRAFT_1108156 [Mycena vulgaris]